jgi:hypothetical protein
VTTRGSSRTSAWSERDREPMSRRISLVALWLYAVLAAADIAVHLNDDRQAGQDWLAPDNLAVAVSAGLFWPVDLVARRLLAR